MGTVCQQPLGAQGAHSYQHCWGDARESPGEGQGCGHRPPARGCGAQSTHSPQVRVMPRVAWHVTNWWPVRAGGGGGE